MKTKLLPIVLALAALPPVAFGQETRLSPVVVPGARVDDLASPTAVERAALPALRAATSDTAALLRNIPGVSLYGAGGVSSLPAIHGLADDRLRIKVDGMDLVASCPNHMNPPLSYLDPSNLGALKVYAGIAPVSVGGDSIGGSIVAETPAPVFAAPGQGSLLKGEVGAFYRSNGNAKGGNLAATYANESFSISYAGAIAESDNYDAGGKFRTTTATGRIGRHLGRDEVGSTAYETRNHTLGLALRGGNHLVELKLGYQDLPYQLYPNQRMDMLDNEQKRFNLRYLGQFGWGALEARVYRETVSHHMDFGADKRFWYGAASGGPGAAAGSPCAPIGMSCAAGMPMDTDSETTGATIKASIDLSPRDQLRLGAELQRYRLDDWWPPSGGGMWPGTFWNIRDGERDRRAVYAEWEGRLGSQWTALAGARHERVETDAGHAQGYSTMATAMGNQFADANAFNARRHARTDNNVDLTALLRYAADGNTDLEFGLARKVRSPNLYERYSWSTWAMAAVMNNFVGDGNGYIGDVDLKPEKANTVSATIDWHAADRAWEFKATPHYSRVGDYIDAVRCPAGAACTAANAATTNQFVVLKYANQSARLYGIDLSGRMPLANSGAGAFGLRGLVSYTNGKNRDTGDDLYNIMPLNARLTLSHKLGGWDNAVELVGVKAKDKVSDARNEIKTAGYSLVNLRASYSWQQARVDVGVENLFDKRYDLPLGGAYVAQGTTMSINGIPWGIAVPGMGRSFYTGVTYKF